MPLALDLGCGPNIHPGFVGVDIRRYPGVDIFITDLRRPWPWGDCSVDEAICSHFLEHLEAQERIHFMNELHRVLKPGAKVLIKVPHWSSSNAYCDLDHKWPPVVEGWFNYLNKAWRDQLAPHSEGYLCDFEWWATYSKIHEEFAAKDDETKKFAQRFYRDIAKVMDITLTKRATTP
jgi:SAM-dependent methyltransferase